MRPCRLPITLLSLAIASAAFSQGSPDVIAKIIQLGKEENQTRDHLEHLCLQIGSRLTGSLALQKACEWTRNQFDEYGLNARLEQWGEIPVGFNRKPWGHTGQMLFPTQRNFQFTTRSWTPGTHGVARGQAIMEPEDPTTLSDAAMRGKWLVLRPRGREDDRTALEALLVRASNAGILGTVSGARSDLVITSGSWDVDMDNLPNYCAVIVRDSDYEAITSVLEDGLAPVLEFNLVQSFRVGPMPLYNVIAEIPGTVWPDQVVMMGGHLDSWDGPGNQGTCDNGTGSSVTLEAARLLMASGAKPKRTIRFVLWTGEEQGLHGSRNYVEMHKDELDQISCILIDDGGTNYWGGFSVLASQRPMFEQAMQPLHEAFPNLPISFNTIEQMPQGGGSDHAPFNRAGVPGFFSDETGVADYRYIHHTQHDSIPAAINEYLVQSSVAAAVTAYNLACADEMLPRQPQ